MTIDQLTQYATVISAIGGGLYGFWKFILKPIHGLIKKINQTSSNISESLPILIEIAKDFGANNKLKDIIIFNKINSLFNRQRGRIIIDHLDLIYLESDLNGKCAYVSQEWTKLTNLDLEQSLGDGWTNAIHADDRSQIINLWNHAIKHKIIFDANFKIINGKKINCHTWIVRHPENSIDITGAISIFKLLD